MICWKNITYRLCNLNSTFDIKVNNNYQVSEKTKHTIRKLLLRSFECSTTFYQSQLLNLTFIHFHFIDILHFGDNNGLSYAEKFILSLQENWNEHWKALDPLFRMLYYFLPIALSNDEKIVGEKWRKILSIYIYIYSHFLFFFFS